MPPLACRMRLCNGRHVAAGLSSLSASQRRPQQFAESDYRDPPVTRSTLKLADSLTVPLSELFALYERRRAELC